MTKKIYLDAMKNSQMEGLVPGADILLLDVCEEEIAKNVSKLLAVPYLGVSEKKEAKEIGGIIWGMNRRLFASFIVEFRGQKKDVIFLVDTGAGHTYLCEKAIKSFYTTKCDILEQSFSMKLNGITHDVTVSPLKSHFNDINILGGMFLNSCKAKLLVDFDEEVKSFQIKFP